MNIKELKKAIEQTYIKYFPKSKICIQLYTSLGTCIFINSFLAKTSEEEANNYFENDMFHIAFSMPLYFNVKSEDDELPSNLMLINNKKSYVIKPADNIYYCNLRKISFRKTTGNAEKIISALDKFFKKLKDQILKDIKADNIHKDYQLIVKNKIL